MKILLLAGGFGSRLSEETDVRPKPMVEIGEKPILWHIMKGYSHYGFNNFVVLLGYKGYHIKEYFINYFRHQSDITVDLENNGLEFHKAGYVEPWKITLADTGLNTMTGGRIRRAKKYVKDQTFMVTYGDGVANIDIKALLEFHKSHGKLATVTAVQPFGRFGAMALREDNIVVNFAEKPRGDGSWINGGFFVFEPGVFNLLQGDSTILERDPLESLAQNGQLVAYKHHGFWMPMDTLRDKNELNSLWASGRAPWKVWE